MKKSTSIILVVFLALNLNAVAQFTANPNPTIQQLVNNVLLGSGVNVTNIQFNGDTVQIGSFNGGTTGDVNIGIDSGLVISTGNIIDISTPASENASTNIQNALNTPFDQDMTDLMHSNPNTVNEDVNDVAVLEFDFVPLGDSIKFEYFFASEEYEEFVCSFNDAFGMILSGPGITGPYLNNGKNIALIPNTEIPVSIYNVNQTDDACDWANSNQEYYVGNPNGSDFTFDGLTTVLTAKSAVVCGQTYHLKFMIADAGDNSYDSGVFLKARSLSSNQVDFVPTSSSGIVGDSSLVEGCNSGLLTFSRPGSTADTLSISVAYSGSAQMGVDYNILPTTVTFLPGQNLLTFPVTAVQDNEIEGDENIVITLTFLTGCGSFTFSRSMYIVNPAPLQLSIQDENICPGTSTTLVPFLTGGYPPYTYLWSTGDTTATLEISLLFTTNISLTVTAPCLLQQVQDTALINVFNVPFFNITPTENNQSVETCNDTINAIFTISIPQLTPTTYDLTIGGTATFGSDYQVIGYPAGFPTSITFPAGVDTIIIPFTIINDGLTELNEDISITSQQQCNNNELIFTWQIVNFEQLTVSLPNVNQICPNSNATIVATINGTNNTNNSITWSNNNSTLQTAVYPAVPQTVYITVTETLCDQLITHTDSTTISIYPQLSVENIVASADTNLLCPNLLRNLSINVLSSATSQITYTWLPNASNINNVNVNPDTTTQYTVIVKDICNTVGITKKITLVVPEYPALTAQLPNDTLSTCPNSPINVVALVNGGGPFKIARFDGVKVNNLDSVFISSSDTVTHYFTVKDTCGSSASDSIKISTKVYGPTLISMRTDTLVCPDFIVNLFANVSKQNYNNVFAYNWVTMPINSKGLVSIIDNDDVLQTTTTIKDSAYFILTATDLCLNSVSDTVIIGKKKTCELVTYNVFTPGSDDSKNAKFIISSITEYPDNSVEIFDRWGKKVFEQTNYSDTNAWDGQDVNAGTYYYIVKVKPKQGTIDPITGFVEVIK
jgi:gliding motility-associated-like protein